MKDIRKKGTWRTEFSMKEMPSMISSSHFAPDKSVKRPRNLMKIRMPMVWRQVKINQCTSPAGIHMAFLLTGMATSIRMANPHATANAACLYSSLVKMPGFWRARLAPTTVNWAPRTMLFSSKLPNEAYLLIVAASDDELRERVFV